MSLLLQVELEFLPWLMQQALAHVEQEALARAVLQQIVADAVAAQVGGSKRQGRGVVAVWRCSTSGSVCR